MQIGRLSNRYDNLDRRQGTPGTSESSSMRRRLFAGMKSLTGFGSRSRQGSPGHRSISLPESTRLYDFWCYVSLNGWRGNRHRAKLWATYVWCACWNTPGCFPFSFHMLTAVDVRNWPQSPQALHSNFRTILFTLSEQNF